jgi:hypothetical protein
MNQTGIEQTEAFFQNWVRDSQRCPSNCVRYLEITGEVYHLPPLNLKTALNLKYLE